MSEYTDEMLYNAIVEYSRLVRDYAENVKIVAQRGALGHLEESIELLKEAVSKLDWAIRTANLKVCVDEISQKISIQKS